MRENFQLIENNPNYIFNWEGAYRYTLMEEYYPEEFEKVNILRARAAKNPKAKAAVARMDEELSKLFTVEKSRGDSHEEDVRKAREIIRKTTEISR